MARLFICYRRDDNNHAAGRIADQMALRFGPEFVFRDVDKLFGADQFNHRILNSLAVSDLVLVIIGDRWLTGSRGEQNHDAPALGEVLKGELEYSLRRGLSILPVLIDGASMPEARDLPESVRAITEFHAVNVRDTDFGDDIESLVSAIRRFDVRKILDIPVPKPGEPVTGEHLALIYSCWRSPRYDGRFSNKVYRFDVIVEADPSVSERIDKVIYMLPPAWPNASSPKEVDRATPSFGLKEITWADVLVRARVYMQNQLEPVYLSSFVRLAQDGGRLL